MLSREPVMKLSIATTSQPRASSASTVCEGTNPAPPLTRIRCPSPYRCVTAMAVTLSERDRATPGPSPAMYLMSAVSGERPDLELGVLGFVVLLGDDRSDPPAQEADRDRDDARVGQRE